MSSFIKVKPLHIALSALMLLLMLLFYAGLTSITYYMGQKNDLHVAGEIVEGMGQELEAVFRSESLPIESAVSVLAESRLAITAQHEERMLQINTLAAALTSNPSSASVYVGHENGSFLLLRKLDTASDKKTFAAPEGAVYLLQSINRDKGQEKGTFVFYDADLKVMQTLDKPEYRFDPRTRPWYQSAMATAKNDRVIETAPYIFASNQKIGITFAARNSGSVSVVGMDITLGSLSRLLERQQVTPSSELVVFNESDKVLAYRQVKRIFKTNAEGKREVVSVAELGVPAITEMHAIWKNAAGAANQETKMSLNGEEWFFRVVKIREKNGQNLFLAVAAPKSELMSNSIQIRNMTFWASLFFMLLMLPAVYYVSKLVSRPIRQLVKVATAIERFDFEGPDPVNSKITEVDDLSHAMSSMKYTLKRFLEISAALSAESNFHKLIGIILRETISVAGGRGGSLVLVCPDGKTAQTAARQLKGESRRIDNSPVYELKKSAETPLEIMAMIDGILLSKRISRNDENQARIYAELFDELGVEEAHLLAIPLRNRSNEVIGAMTLCLNAPVKADDEPISATMLAFIEALSGTAAVAMDNQKLVLDQKMLFESVIKVVAGSIDAKSPYSGGHCQRVPELSKMLARAACAQNDGPFAAFNMTDEQWEALHIAGWLHDCGKLTTPEFVVDKATKLETIYDRIHEVRMRFEVLKRDVEIDAYLRALSNLPAGQVNMDALRAEIAAAQASLDDDFQFVATCNVGGEFMAADKIERLKAIAQRRWLRTLDDRAGVSQEELMRKEVVPAEAPPVWEALLSDKPDHIFPRPVRERLAEDNVWGFKIKPPENLYNRGELYNLCIGRGTLTEEDRYKINEHIVYTIKMLSELPFPKHLRRVPEIAGGHHEKLDGTGYPCRLTKDEMSIEARMMAIADVFEALTAVDRPYKKGKTLSEAVKIMGFMKKDKHIDPELFELFLTSGVYLEYAQRFMRPEQIDTVDAAAYVSQ